MRISVSLAFLIFASCQGLNQRRFIDGVGALHGNVIFEPNASTDVQIIAVKNETVLVRSVVSAGGFFALSGLPAGSVQLTAFDAQGNLAQLTETVVANVERETANLKLAPPNAQQLISLFLVEQRLTSAGEIVQAFLSRDSDRIVFRDRNEVWYAARLSRGTLKEVREISVPKGEPIGVASHFLFGFENFKNQWRVDLDSSAIQTQMGSWVQCQPAFPIGTLCATETSADPFLELRMFGSLSMWASAENAPRKVIDREPDGFDLFQFDASRREIWGAFRAFSDSKRSVFRMSLPSLEASTFANGDGIVGFSLSPNGVARVIRKAANTISFEGVGGTPKVALGEFRLDAFRFDAGLESFVIGATQVGTKTQKWFLISENSEQVSTREMPPISAEWFSRENETTLAIRKVDNGFSQIFLRSNEHELLATALKSDHDWVGWVFEENAFAVLATDPQTGVRQLFYVRAPELMP